MHPVIFGIKRAFLSSTTFLRRQLRRHFGLTQARFDVLYLVYKGHREQLAVRRMLAITSSTLSEMLQTLERLGFITRGTSSFDRRARTIALTEMGRKRTAACIEQWITHRAGLRMVRNIFAWKSDPDRAFHHIDDFESYVVMTERWFTQHVACSIYPGFHPDD